MSIPPVIITRLIPQERIIKAAFSLSMLKKVCTFVKPEPMNIIAQIYITTNIAMVMTRSRLESDNLPDLPLAFFRNFMLIRLLDRISARS